MKKTLTVIFLLFCSICFGKDPLSNALFSKCRGPSQPLLDLLEHNHISHEGTWPSIVEVTQKYWLRHPAQERWELSQLDIDNQNWIFFTDLNLTQPFYAESPRYDYAVILGATVQTLRNRVWHLNQEWQRGIRFNSIVVLTGDRPLSTIETPEILLDPNLSTYPFRSSWKFSGQLPTTEGEMARLVFDQLDLPEDLAQIPIQFIQASCKDGKKRPDTADTVREWLTREPKAGSILMVSNQPYLARQENILRSLLPAFFSVDAIGSSITPEKENLTVIFDELARLIYQVNLSLLKL